MMKCRASVGALAAAVIVACCRPAPSVERRLAPIPAERDDDKSVRLIADARTLADHFDEVFRNEYAPAALKERTIGWSLSRELATLRAVINGRPSPSKEAIQHAFVRFFRSMRDIHTSIAIESDDREVWLGIHLLSTNDGVRVAWIDPKLAAQIPVHVGDEVVRFDGAPVVDALRAIAEDDGYHSTAEFERAFSEWFLTVRTPSDLSAVPASGSIARLAIRARATPDKVSVIEMPWRDLSSDGPSERCPFWPKSKTSILPPLGTVVWSTPQSSRFAAYVFEVRGKRYGFARLQTWDVPKDETLTDIQDFDAFITELIERDAAGLILDQRGNGGGNFLFAYVMLSRLFVHPIVLTKQRYVERGSDVVGFGLRDDLAAVAARLSRVTTNDEARLAIDSIPILADHFGFGRHDVATAKEAASFFGFLAAQPAGLSPPYFELLPQIAADPQRGPVFTKPVLMMVDGMSISAADFVPATLQDNHRAIIFGTTTSGAGGDQRRIGLDDACTPERAHELLQPCAPAAVVAAMKTLGVKSYAYTVTLGSRPGDRVIENVGVVPDVPYQIHADDLKTQFAPMSERLLATLQTTQISP